MDSPFFFMCHRVPWSVSLLDDTESVGCVAQNIGRERDIFILFGCRCCYMWTCTKGRGGKKITSAEVRRFRILWRSWKGEAVCVCVLTDLRVVWHTTRVPSKNFCPSLPFPLGPARKESKKKRVMTPRSAPTSAATTWAHSTGTTGHPYLRNKIVIRQTLLPLSIMTLKKWNINSVSMHPQTHNLRFWILWRFFFQSFFVVATGCLLLMEMSV